MQVALRYVFDRPTGAGRQLFRILPATIPGIQTLVAAEIRIDPDPVETGEFTDFFGTRVIALAMPPGLTELELVLEAKVERATVDAGLDISVPLHGLAAEIAAVRAIDASAPHHFLRPTARIPASAPIAAYARQITADASTARQAVEMLGRALNRDMHFDAKATDVNTLPADAFRLKRGVCQDFTQIMVSGLRSLGIPAAHAGGYLRTLPPAGEPRLVGADATHAWVRAWCGLETGWVDYDPTNRCFALGDHISVGFGRDYDDIAPVVGMLRMDGKQVGSQSVDIAEAPVQDTRRMDWITTAPDPIPTRRLVRDDLAGGNEA